MQRSARRRLEQDAQQKGECAQFIQGMQAIGAVGKSLFDQKRDIAQALATGQALGIDPDSARAMGSSENVINAAKVQQGNIQMPLLMMSLRPELANSPEFAKYMHPSAQAAPSSPMQLTGGIPGQTPQATPGPTTTPGIPSPIPTMNKATAALATKVGLANRPEPVMTQDAALQAGSVPHGTRIINPVQQIGDKKEQDGYYRDAVRGLQSIRGDQQVKDIEGQRNAAISAFNRLKQIQLEGKAPNPVDYADIVGQVYKARTGQAPTDTILKKALQETAAGKWGEALTYLTGTQQPGTTKDIAASLMNMVAHMGLQADDLHQGVMQTHGSMIFNPNMSAESVARLTKVARGKTFAEATGVKPEDFDPHVQAIKWAQGHPNDPRSAPILQKAMQAQGGGSIGL
jgi:hypothetical protein